MLSNQYDNIDSSESRIGRGGTHASGQFGDVPQYLVNRKYERTDLVEDPYETSSYQRGMLMHMGPDPQLFEHEQTRRDNHSEEKLNVRYHGARSEFMPLHPEIFLGFTEADSRGTQTEPDMRKLYDQSRFRGRYHRFYPDNDDSVPESGRNEQQVIADKRKGFYWVKDALKIFSTSHDGRAAGRPMGAKRGYDIDLVTDDGQLKDLNYGRNHIHRGDKTTILSNYYPMGWYRTTDHEFKVAQYGVLYKSARAADMDLRGIMNETEIDGPNPIVYRDNLLPKAAVHKMKRIVQERDQKLPAHFQLSIEEKVRNLKRPTQVNKRSADAAAGVRTEHRVVASMVDATRAVRRGEADPNMMARSVEQSAVTAQLAEQQANAITPTNEAFGGRDKGISRRRTTAASDFGTTRQTKDYSGAKPKRRNANADATQAPLTNYDGEDWDAHTLETRADFVSANGRVQQDRHEAGDLDNDFLDSYHMNRSNGRMEDRATTRQLMDYDVGMGADGDYISSINDSSSRLSSTGAAGYRARQSSRVLTMATNEVSSYSDLGEF